MIVNKKIAKLIYIASIILMLVGIIGFASVSNIVVSDWFQFAIFGSLGMSFMTYVLGYEENSKC